MNGWEPGGPPDSIDAFDGCTSTPGSRFFAEQRRQERVRDEYWRAMLHAMPDWQRRECEAMREEWER